MKRKLQLYTVGIFMFSLVMFCSSQRAYAANEAQQSGFGVSPAQLSFTVQPDAPTQTADLKLTNSYDSPLRLTTELQSIDETGVRLVPNGPIDEQLERSIQVSVTDITVPAKGSFDLKITVDGTLLTDGGHYASLVIMQRSNVGSTAGFRSAVAVNLFIIKNEHIRTDLQLMNLTFDRPLLSLPKTASLVLRNGGNTHIVPRASVIVYDGQDIVSKAVVNTNSTLFLPGHQEKFTVSLDTYKRFWLPRRLIARTMYRIDGSDVQLIKEQVLWHIPFVDIIGVIALGFATWRWRRTIRATYVHMRTIVKARFRSKKSKNASIHTLKEGADSIDVVSPRKGVNLQSDMPMTVRVTRPLQSQNETISHRISVHTPTPLEPQKKTASPVKHIDVTLKEEAINVSRRATPKKKANVTKKRPTTKTKAPSKPKIKSTTKPAKKRASKRTSKKSF